MTKIGFVCKVLGFVFIGMLGIYFMCSGHKNEQAILQNAKVCFEEALQQEKTNHTTQMYISYNASTATCTLDDVLDWSVQNVSIKEDSCRHGLDSLFYARLAKAGLPVQTAISYTWNGRITVSKPHLDLSHMYLVDNKVYSMKQDTIRLQAYIPIASVNAQKYKFNIGLGLVIGSILLGLGFWWVTRKKQDVIDTIEVIEETTSCSQGVLIGKNCYWESRSGIISYADKSVKLTGMPEKLFNLLVESKDHIAMYEEFLVFYPEQKLTKTTIDKIQHTIVALKKNLKAFPIVFKSIRGKGYQLQFNEEDNSISDDHCPD